MESTHSSLRNLSLLVTVPSFQMSRTRAGKAEPMKSSVRSAFHSCNSPPSFLLPSAGQFVFQLSGFSNKDFPGSPEYHSLSVRSGLTHAEFGDEDFGALLLNLFSTHPGFRSDLQLLATSVAKQRRDFPSFLSSLEIKVTKLVLLSNFVHLFPFSYVFVRMDRFLF